MRLKDHARQVEEMSRATFIGIDLAWKSESKPSGAAVLRGDRNGAKLELITTLRSIDQVLELVRSYSTANTILAIDAPLIITNRLGQRRCETLVGNRYGSRDASCHTSNLKRDRNPASVRLAVSLVACGFCHVDECKVSRSGRQLAEVYPHAAMVALFDLEKTLKYKKGPMASRRLGLMKLQGLLRKLKSREPKLISTHSLQRFLGEDLSELRGSQLKDYEDRIDALFCAYLAFYFWYWGWERNEPFGDVKSGYILNPKLSQLVPSGRSPL